MDKTILFYKFINIKDPEMAMLWQKELCLRLGLTGRVIVAGQGINGTLGGDIDALRYYKKAMNASGIFRGIHYKWSMVPEGEEIFPRLSVRVRDELVSFGAGDEIKVDDETGVIGGGGRIRADQLHGFLETHPDAIFFDGRNLYESNVGKFKDAVLPQVNTSREFIHEIEKPEYEALKDKTIITYCTGGIRCEMLTVLMKNRGFNDVYQLDGGIVTYGKDYGKKGLWEGTCYVFDGRILSAFSVDRNVIGMCRACGDATEHYSHCSNEPCGTQMLICETCDAKNETHLCDVCAS